MTFLNKLHEQRFDFLTQEDVTSPYDNERQALFYILSGNSDLFSKRNYIYDFDERCISIDCLDSDKVDFSTSAKALVRLGFNLYNRYSDDRTNPMDIFYSLDSSNYNIAMFATDLRFGMAITNEKTNDTELEDDYDLSL